MGKIGVQFILCYSFFLHITHNYPKLYTVIKYISLYIVICAGLLDFIWYLYLSTAHGVADIYSLLRPQKQHIVVPQ